MLMRRMGRPGLLGLAARTAVVAGTASATVGAVSRRQQQRSQQQQEAQAYEQSQQLAAAPVQAPPAGPDASSDLLAQISQLSDLHASGALTDDEFAAAKAKLLGT